MYTHTEQPLVQEEIPLNHKYTVEQKSQESLANAKVSGEARDSLGIYMDATH